MDRKKWYMITTISGREEKVIESLKNRVISEKVEDLFDDFKVMLVPHLTPRELKKYLDGEDYKIKMKSLFPGYIFIKMEMTNEAWFMVRNTQYVTGLVGSSGQRSKPTPVSNLEMRKMEKQVQRITDDFNSGKVMTPFEEGILVEVIDGPTKGQVGPIIEINNERQVAVVELIMFERKTPTEIEYKNLKIKK
ncbi:MAG: transcription termination/antitermination protein NusG [Mycoplasmatales bacterium]|nr:transcription termination/antitermination protein NusG [Mycoplasmatales bacterium]